MKRHKTALWFVFLAIMAFATIGLEAVLSMILEPIVYGYEMSAWSTPQFIMHWSITCAIWGASAAALIYLAKEKCDFDLFRSGSKMTSTQWLIIAEIVVGSLIISCIDWNGAKIIKEFMINGWLKFIFQYIYYLFEMVLVTLILVFSQKAGEIWFRKKNIPYGGIVIALTWGAAHFFTKGVLSGILGMAAGIAFGFVYLLVNRDIKKAYPILFVIFAL